MSPISERRIVHPAHEGRVKVPLSLLVSGLSFWFSAEAVAEQKPPFLGRAVGLIRDVQLKK